MQREGRSASFEMGVKKKVLLIGSGAHRNSIKNLMTKPNHSEKGGAEGFGSNRVVLRKLRCKLLRQPGCQKGSSAFLFYE